MEILVLPPKLMALVAVIALVAATMSRKTQKVHDTGFVSVKVKVLAKVAEISVVRAVIDGVPPVKFRVVIDKFTPVVMEM